LKSYLNVVDKAELLEFWFTVAAAKKKQEFSVIRESPDAYSRSDQAFIALAPIPTPKLVSDLVTITFVSDHPDNLKTGIQPFVVMDGSEEYRLAAQNLAQSYTLFSEREYNISYSDLDHFKVPKDLRAHPTTFFELEKSLGLFGNLLGTVLGNAHPLTTSYWVFWTTFTRQFCNKLHFEIDSRHVIKPVHILRNIQLIVCQWFQSKKSKVSPGLPPFQDIITRMSLPLYTNPTLPHTLYQLVSQRPAPTFSGMFDKPPPALDDATTATGLSTLTPGTATPSQVGSQVTSRSGTFVRNAAVDSTFQGLLLPGVKINDLVGSDPIPTTADGNPFCLAYHVRGGCFSNC
jgi:hypothetical protein